MGAFDWLAVFQLEKCIGNMNDVLKDGERTSAAIHILTRHRDMHTDYTHEFTKAKVPPV